MSAGKHTPGLHVTELSGRWYSVGVRDDGTIATVRVHVVRDGCCVALRRIPLGSPKARAAIAKAVQP